MNTGEYFNMVAEKWDDTVHHEESKINKIIEIINIKHGSTILDVGTGTGVMIPFLYSSVGESGKIIAVDLSENMINVAKSKYDYKNVVFLVNDVLSEDFPVKQFDYIICYSMFPHFTDKRKSISILSSYLNKHGKLVICHSQSRQEINDLHKNDFDSKDEVELPALIDFGIYFDENGLKTVVEVDNSEMFIVIGEKD